MQKQVLLVMLIFGAITLFGAGFYSAHAESNENQQSSTQVHNTDKQNENSNEPVGKKKVSVKAGDTLSSIAKDNETTYKRLFYANESIRHPDTIYPGDKIRIPHSREKLKERALPEDAPTVAYQPNSQSQPAPQGGAVDGGVWDRLAACESGGNWATNTGNGYSGGLQFSQSTWEANGGAGSPHQASKAEQIRVAENLRASSGYSPWPSCSAQLGL